MDYESLVTLLQSSSVGDLVDIESIHPEKTFDEIGMDSLSIFEWLSLIEEKYEINISEKEYNLINTPGDLHCLVVEKLRG